MFLHEPQSPKNNRKKTAVGLVVGLMVGLMFGEIIGLMVGLTVGDVGSATEHNR